MGAVPRAKSSSHLLPGAIRQGLRSEIFTIRSSCDMLSRGSRLNSALNVTGASATPRQQREVQVSLVNMHLREGKPMHSPRESWREWNGVIKSGPYRQFLQACMPFANPAQQITIQACPPAPQLFYMISCSPPRIDPRESASQIAQPITSRFIPFLALHHIMLHHAKSSSPTKPPHDIWLKPWMLWKEAESL